MLRHGKATLRSGFFYARNKCGFVFDDVLVCCFVVMVRIEYWWVRVLVSVWGGLDVIALVCGRGWVLIGGYVLRAAGFSVSLS